MIATASASAPAPMSKARSTMRVAADALREVEDRRLTLA
jgi:hypothetical protein